MTELAKNNSSTWFPYANKCITTLHPKGCQHKKENLLHVTGPYSELTKEGSTKQLLLPHTLTEDR